MHLVIVSSLNMAVQNYETNITFCPEANTIISLSLKFSNFTNLSIGAYYSVSLNLFFSLYISRKFSFMCLKCLYFSIYSIVFITADIDYILAIVPLFFPLNSLNIMFFSIPFCSVSNDVNILSIAFDSSFAFVII